MGPMSASQQSEIILFSICNDFFLLLLKNIFYKRNKILEGSTTNIICVRNNKLFIPKNSYYHGITISYLLKKDLVN